MLVFLEIKGDDHVLNERTHHGFEPAATLEQGKLIGPKPPLQPRHVWAIRTRLQLAGRTRDLALFNLAIASYGVAMW